MSSGRISPRPVPYRAGWQRPTIQTASVLNNDKDESGSSRVRSLTRHKKRPLPIRTQGLSDYASRRRESSEFLFTPPGVSSPQNTNSPFQSPASASFEQFSESSDRRGWDSSSPTAFSPTGLLLIPKRAEKIQLSSERQTGDFNTQTISEKYNISPSQGLLLYPEDVEKDDWLHNPDKTDETNCNPCSGRGLVNSFGMGLLILGLMALFIGYPVL
jgi:hypothetical protein